MRLLKRYSNIQISLSNCFELRPKQVRITAESGVNKKCVQQIPKTSSAKLANRTKRFF